MPVGSDRLGGCIEIILSIWPFFNFFPFSAFSPQNPFFFFCFFFFFFGILLSLLTHRFFCSLLRRKIIRNTQVCKRKTELSKNFFTLFPISTYRLSSSWIWPIFRHKCASPSNYREAYFPYSWTKEWNRRHLWWPLNTTLRTTNWKLRNLFWKTNPIFQTT